MAEKILDIYHQEIELTSEQEACLKYAGKRTLLVKGYAGAGKSLVLMAITKKYLDSCADGEKNPVGIFTFQNTLVSTIREFLEVNRSSGEGASVSTINAHVKSIYERMVEEGAAEKRKYPMGENRRLQNVEKALEEHRKKFGKHRFHDLEPSFWLEEFDWMKDMNVWTDDEDYYLSLPRRGRGSGVRMSTSDRLTAYQLYCVYCDCLEKSGQGDWADQTLFVVRHPELIPEEMKFDHVLIDEGQDLSLAQMTALMALFKKDMTVAMDMNQKIHSRYWTPKLLGFESTTRKLTKSMRTTKQIEALAESLRARNDDRLSEDDKSLRAIPEKEGEKPRIVHLKDAAAEQKYVVELVKAYQRQNPLLTIGIIAAKNSQIRLYSDWLTSAEIPHEQVTRESSFSMAKPGVKVVNAFGAKGLEFNCVIIPMFAEGYFPYRYHPDDPEILADFMIKMRNLVYVSMTRARNLLTFTFWGKNGSRFISEMDPQLYLWDGEAMDEGTAAGAPKDSLAGEQARGEDQSASPMAGEDLKGFLTEKGLELIDKRPAGGTLWAVGGRDIEPALKESRKYFGSVWIFCTKGGSATRNRPAWFTHSRK